MLPRVAVIYLSYNCVPYLAEVMASVATLDYPKELLDLIIVDNASGDKSVELIQQTVLPKSGHELPRVTFFPNATNLGFAAGNNLGINHALLAGADFVFLLNNDAKFHSDALKEAVAMVQDDEKIGSVQSLLLLWQKPDTINSSGNHVHFLGFGFAGENGVLLEKSRVQNRQEIAYGSGAGILYRASVLREIGLLDTFFFMYHEDLELGWRIRLAGYKNVLAKKSVVYHHYEFSRSIKKYFWMERNRSLVLFTMWRWPTLLLLTPFLFLQELFLLVISVRHGWFKEEFLAGVDLLRPRTGRYILEKRHQMALLRRVSDKEIARLIDGFIDYQEQSSSPIVTAGNYFLAGVWWILKKVIVW